ncbi:GntR family transcriptional regulator [Mesorhizobium sp. M0830]|uniref:GntR family transcriptional regulator n=1 Tax=Mesorhizobium sp. M0830 TaxID=2957008 RepID=UPI003339153A
MDQEECIEIYKIREQLEPLALRESTPNLPDQCVEHLASLAEAIETAEDIDTFLRLDREFHILSYQGAAMPRLLQMIETYWNSTQHYRRAFAIVAGGNAMSAVRHEHALIVDSIARRDGEQASLLLYGHIRRTRLELQSHRDIFT